MDITETTNTERTFTLTGVTLLQLQLIHALTGKVNSAGTAIDAQNASTHLYNAACELIGGVTGRTPFKADMGAGYAITLNLSKI